MRLKRRTVLLAFSLVLLALAALVWVWRPRMAVTRYQRQLRAAGEKLSPEELLTPPPLPDDNGAPLLSQTFYRWGTGTNLLNKNRPAAMQMVAPGKAMVGWAQPEIRSEGTNSWGEIEAALSQDEDLLELARAAAERPALDFRLDYRQGFSLLLPHLAPLKATAQRLTTATLCELHEGDAAAAAAELRTLLALVKGMAGERLMISQLVRIAMAHIALTATWELLQSPHSTEDQLAALQRHWAELEFLEPAERSLEMERALAQMTLERMRKSSAQFQQVLSLGGGGVGSASLSAGPIVDTVLRNTALKAQEARWRLVYSYPDQLRALKGYQVLLESFRSLRSGQPFQVVLSRQQGALAELGIQREEDREEFPLPSSDQDLRALFSQAVLSASGVLNRVYVMEVARQLTTTAIALKRYHLRHQQYPAELAALVPELLAAPPLDPVDGRPLRYRLRPDGSFLLYSIGEDGVDNNGDAASVTKSDSVNWQKGRDVVWPRPATPEEVGAYQQKKHKAR